MQRDLVRAGVSLLLVLAALSSLTRVFADTSWVPVALGAALLSLAVASASRMLGFRLAGTVAASLVALTAFVYTQHLGPGPLLPGLDQLREALDLFRLGLTQFRDEPAPTVPLDGLLLITSTGTWVVAVATHEILVRLESVGIGLLPAGVLWAVPLAVPLPAGRTWPQALPFAAAAAVAMLLEGDHASVTRADGRPATGDPGGNTGRLVEPGLAARRSSLVVGGALATIALVVAGIAPAILPGYEAASWLDLNRGPDPRGYQPIVDIGDRLKLPERADIMIVQADRRTYLRLAALDSFDGTTWKLGPPGQATFQPTADQLFPADGTLPRETAIAEGVALEVDVEVLDLENIYVPVPYQAVRLDGDGVDEMVYSIEGGFVAAGSLEDNEIGGRQATGIRSGTRYRVESVLPTASYADLTANQYSAASVARWTQLPDGGYPDLRQQAMAVYEAAGATTAIDRAFALQDWFTGPNSAFRYSLDVDALRGDAALQDFVFATQTGYCEYFATAMAVMLRETGVPARVAVGFLAGQLTLPADPAVGRTRNTYTVTTSDAHAWVEVLFPGRGWLRFEPTPRSDGATMAPRPDELDPVQTERERLLAEAADRAAEEELAEPTDGPSAGPTERDLSQLDDSDVGSPGAGTGVAAGASGWLMILLAVLAVAGGAAAWRFRGRVHHPDVSPSERVALAQQRLHHHASGWGVGRADAETPREIADRWVAEGRVESSAAHRFTDLVESSAFGAGVDAAQSSDAEDLAEAMIVTLRASVAPRERLVAPLREPATLLRRLGRRLTRLE